MDQNKYNEMILNKIEGVLNWVMPIGAMIAFVGAIMIYVQGKDARFIVLDCALSCILLLSFALRKQIPIRIKIGTVAFATWLLGVFSIYYSGFSGNGLLLLLLSCLIFTSFLSIRSGIVMSFVSCAVLLLVPLLLLTNRFQYQNDYQYVNNSPTEWFVHILVFGLICFVIVLTVYAIKTYLISNIFDLELSTNHIKELAYTDALTGLPNKNMFAEVYQEAPESGYIVVFRVDDYDLMKSFRGSATGEMLIKLLAESLIKALQAGEHALKTGDNEFAMLLSRSDRAAISKTLREMVTDTRQTAKVVEASLSLDIYAGCIQYNKSIDTKAMDLYHKASLALELGKSKRIFLSEYDAKANEEFRRRESLRSMLVDAIDQKEFVVYYQEKIDCASNRVIGVEALTRWNSPTLGLVPPDTFIPIIEHSSMNVAFGNLVVSMVMKEYPAICQKYESPISVAINISPAHFVSEGFAEYAILEAQKHQIDPSFITFEITEETMSGHFDEINGIIQQLKISGFKVSIDDFGTGYSSLSYLARLDIDELKIDKSFIQAMTHNGKTESLVRSIINLKETYGFRVVAEGVETEDQRDILKEMGCHVLQGFLFSRPVSIDRLPQMLEA